MLQVCFNKCLNSRRTCFILPCQADAFRSMCGSSRSVLLHNSLFLLKYLLQHKRHDFNNKYLLMCTTIYQVNYYVINERKREARGEIERRGKERKIA